MGRTHMAMAALLCGLVTGCGPVATPAPTTAAEGTCALASLPPEVSETVDLIESGGPFPYPRNDGVVFGNYEGHLPKHERGYYHEYTVPTPGATNRGVRRVVTGGMPLTDPAQFFYTADHYGSFCLIGGL